MTDAVPVVFIEKIIPASPRDVFEAWLDPDALRQFMRAGPAGRVSPVECDPRVGGKFRIVMHIGEREHPHFGEYLEIDRYSKLVFTWNSDSAGKDGKSRVTLRFADAPNGETRLTLEHTGLPDAKAVTGHANGWNAILGELITLQASASHRGCAEPGRQ